MIDVTPAAIVVGSVAAASGIAVALRDRSRRLRSEADQRVRLLKLADRIGLKPDPSWSLAELAYHAHSAAIARTMGMKVEDVLKQLRTVGASNG